MGCEYFATAWIWVADAKGRRFANAVGTRSPTFGNRLPESVVTFVG